MVFLPLTNSLFGDIFDLEKIKDHCNKCSDFHIVSTNSKFTLSFLITYPLPPYVLNPMKFELVHFRNQTTKIYETRITYSNICSLYVFANRTNSYSALQITKVFFLVTFCQFSTGTAIKTVII